MNLQFADQIKDAIRMLTLFGVTKEFISTLTNDQAQNILDYLFQQLQDRPERKMAVYCIAEVFLMKFWKIGEVTTLYDFLFMENETAVGYIGHQHFDNMHDLEAFQDQFPNYGQSLYEKYKKCLTAKEIAEMKGMQFNGKQNLHDMLSMRTEVLKNYVYHKNFKGIRRLYDFEKLLPVHGLALYRKYEDALRFRKLFDAAVKSLKFLLGTELPEYCLKKVADYLDESDLKIIAKRKIVKQRRS